MNISNIPTLVVINPACRRRKIVIPECNIVDVIRVFDHSQVFSDSLLIS